MTDLLTPEEVRGLLLEAESSAKHLMESTKDLHLDFSTTLMGTAPRLCQDYLTLWDRWTFAADTAKKYMRNIKRLDAIILELERERTEDVRRVPSPGDFTRD